MKNDAVKRWAVLFIAALVMMAGYVFWDVVSPVSTILKSPYSEGGMAWTSAEYGFYAGSYSIFNIFLLMLFFGGIILDKCGIRITGLLATGSMLLGAIVNYYAISVISPSQQLIPCFTLGGFIPSPIKVQVLVASMGFALFGMGCDITGITVSKIITKWFTGHELASAMGIQVAMARLGTASALSFSPLIASAFGISTSILVGVIILIIGFVLFTLYCFLDKRYDAETGRAHFRQRDLESTQVRAGEETFRFHDFLRVVHNPVFWLIVILCVFYYSSIRPFMKFATDIMVNTYGVNETSAGWIVSAIPYGAIVLSPLFGALYDRIGRGTLLMLIGCIILTLSHVCLAFPLSHSSAYALAVMFFEGVAFSLVPAALWPSIPKIVPLKQLGTAYSITYYIQNIGLMLVPVWVGHVVDACTAPSGIIDYTRPMLIFISFGVAAIMVSVILLVWDHKYHYGLEEKNIK